VTNSAPSSSGPAALAAEPVEAPTVRLLDVTKRFGALPAVDGLNLNVAEGEFLTLLGPSGCGKTTTLRLIAGFEQPDGGRVLIDGEDMAHRPAYRRPVNTVFQQYALFPHMTIRDNIGYGLKHRGTDHATVKRQVEAMMDLMQIPELGDRRPRQLSGGQQQRVALARALVMEPKVLLLDEPLGSLDYKLRKAMQFELKRIHREVGVTFVYVTHDQEEAMTMSDRVVVMHGGKIEQDATPAEVYDRPNSPFVASFVGDTNLLHGTVSNTTGELVHVDLGLLGSAAGTSPSPLTVGQRVAVSLRPSDVRVSPGGSGAVVTDSVLVGSHIAMSVSAGDQTLRADVAREAAVVPGTHVELAVRSERVRIFAEDEM
jgi:spermidine/putrescine ABC transporter ATP-binding subunit